MKVEAAVLGSCPYQSLRSLWTQSNIRRFEEGPHRAQELCEQEGEGWVLLAPPSLPPPLPFSLINGMVSVDVKHHPLNSRKALTECACCGVDSCGTVHCGFSVSIWWSSTRTTSRTGTGVTRKCRWSTISAAKGC